MAGLTRWKLVLTISVMLQMHQFHHDHFVISAERRRRWYVLTTFIILRAVLANRRPCSNFHSFTPSSPPAAPLLPFPPPPPPPPTPRREAFCCIVRLQNASGRSIFGSLVSIAMSGKMKANPGSDRIWNLPAT